MLRQVRSLVRGGFLAGWAGAVAYVAAAPAALAADGYGLPEIRMSGVNRVPACVTPERLMAFVVTRNPQLAPKFGSIARIYRDIGERTQVRWDYAFFQMILETNYLMYRRGDGSSGDVGMAQNNFAGIGATGGGVPGDRYGDVSTGVLAHIQHLVAYSGEHVERPVASRTRDYQNDIIEISRKLGRRVTFGDLSRRWAVDRAYGRNIETVAELFRRNHCTTTATAVPAPYQAAPAARGAGAPQQSAQTNNNVPRPREALRSSFAPPSRLGAGGIAASARAAGTAPAQPAQPRALVSTVWQRGEETAVPAPRPAQPRAKPTAARADDPAAPAAAATPVVVPSPVTESAVMPPAPVPDQSTGVARFALAQGMIAPGAGAVACRVYSASYGGNESVLIRSRTGDEVRLTALSVSPQERQGMAQHFIANHAPGGEVVGHFDSNAAAVSAARGLCRAQS